MRLDFSILFNHDKDISRTFRNLKDKTVLEVGSAGGQNLETFASKGSECFGVELVKQCCKEGQKTRRRNMIVADACHLPFRTESLDIVFSNEAMSHFTNSMIALNEQNRVLQPKGQLLIRDANILCPFQIFDLLVLYPMRTKGRNGGLRWLLTRNQSKEYDNNIIMKDENVKSLLWWKKQVRQMDGLKLELATTSYSRHLPKIVAKLLELFAGQNIILLRKIARSQKTFS
jgi:ubiquinone/menaquinone biosynthesis C-methylase UbiE